VFVEITVRARAGQWLVLSLFTIPKFKAIHKVLIIRYRGLALDTCRLTLNLNESSHGIVETFVRP
jgi:hypothetical protein